MSSAEREEPEVAEVDDGETVQRFIESVHRMLRANLTLKLEIGKIRQAASELADSEALWELMSTASPDTIMLLDPNDTVELTNRPIEGDRGTEFSGRWLPEYREEATNAVHRSRIEGSQETYEARAKRSDGEVRWYSTRVTPVGEPGPDSRVLVTSTDVTEKRARELADRRGHRIQAVGHLAAGVAHEINTPIQYVGDNARFLRKAFSSLATVLRDYEAAAEGKRVESGCGDKRPPIARPQIEQLLDEVPLAIEESMEGLARVAAIVGAITQFTRPANSGSQANVDINTVIENAVAVCKAERGYMSELTVELDHSVPELTCAERDIAQVIRNLVHNAAHAVSEAAASGRNDGSVIVSSRFEDGAVVIKVEDNGLGIPEHIQDRIFDPFFTTREVGQGMGQGLWFAHTVVTRDHGGSIDFETELGRGTTFVITLPVAGWNGERNLPDTQEIKACTESYS